MTSYLYEITGLVRLELVRLVKSWRWPLAMIICTLGAWRASEQVIRYGWVVRLRPNIWDVYLAFYGEWTGLFINLIVPLIFFLLVGDIIIRDTRSHYMQVIISRLHHRESWWLAKCLSVLITALLFCLVLVLICCVMGLIRGLPISGQLSQVATYTGPLDMSRIAQFHVQPPPIRPFWNNVNVFSHIALLVVRLAVAYTTLALAGILVGLRARNSLLPTGFSVVVLYATAQSANSFSSPAPQGWVRFLWNVMADSTFRGGYAGETLEEAKFGQLFIPYSQTEALGILCLVFFALMIIGLISCSRAEW